MDGITNSMGMSPSKLWKIVKDRKTGVLQFMGLQRVRHYLATEPTKTATKPSKHGGGRGNTHTHTQFDQCSFKGKDRPKLYGAIQNIGKVYQF